MSRTAIAATISVLAAAAGVVALTANAASSSSAPPCIPKLVDKTGPKPVVYECGPATATLHAGGKTYTYRSGFCQHSKSTGLFQVDLGVLAALTKGNGGHTYFSLAVLPKLGSTVSAWNAGKRTVNGPASASGGSLATGTFKGKYGSSFSGSWNCHGAVWQAP